MNADVSKIIGRRVSFLTIFNTDKPCCRNMKLVARQTTAGDGWFDFENIPSGEYWLTVKREGKEMAATVTVDLQRDWKSDCQEQGALIEENTLPCSLTWEKQSCREEL
jgi:hypothetical protein